jgi:GntR family transcriptional regulator
MPVQSPVRQLPLTQQVREILISRINSGVYPPESQLPPESDLAAEFNVSRATVRSALNTLAARGLLIRRQGAGTFVSRLSPISNPLDEAIDFQELIASYGFEPGIQHVHFLPTQPTTKIAEALQIDPETQVLEAHKIFTADGEGVIFCVNSIPMMMFDEDLLEEMVGNPNITEPLYEFLEQRCNQSVEYHFAKIRPSIAKKCEFCQVLPFEPETPVLVIDAIAYSGDGRPLFHTFEYHPENQMTFELVRRRSRTR